MLQAKIFKASHLSVGGEPITVKELTIATQVFNANADSTMVTFDEQPAAASSLSLERIAGTVKLHMDGEYVIATVKLLDTPMGKIAKELHEAMGLQLVPVTTAMHDKDDNPVITIRRLVIPANANTVMRMNTPMHQVQDWLAGVSQWPMNDIVEVEDK